MNARDRMEADLGKQISGKLWRGMADSFDLYDMAELPVEWATSRVFTALLHVLSRSAVRFAVPTDMVCDALRQLIEVQRREQQEEAAADE